MDTTLGFWSPDDEEPMDLVDILRKMQESINAYLTPQVENIPLASPFKNTLTVTKVGPLVALTGGVQREGAPDAGSVVVGSLPAGFAPVSEAGSIIGTVYGTTTTYQMIARPNGNLAFRMTAATGNTMNVNMVWTAAA